jgi:hypothetical protein
MKGSEGAFPVSGSASQVVNPGISRREWYVGQLIASGRFEVERDLTVFRAATVRALFEVAGELCDEADRIAAQERQLGPKVCPPYPEYILKDGELREVPEVVSGFVEIPVESAAALKDIMAAGGSMPLCGPSWIAAPIQAMQKSGIAPDCSWRADWGECVDPVEEQKADHALDTNQAG